MPSPSAISRQLFRSRGVPLSSRGYHTNGAEMRPPIGEINDQTILSHSHALRLLLHCTGVFKEFIPTPQ